MDMINIFRLLSPEVQLTLVIGSFSLLLLLACSRSAGDNLLRFFRGFIFLLEERKRRQAAKMQKYDAAIAPQQHRLDKQSMQHTPTQKREQLSRLFRRDGVECK